MKYALLTPLVKPVTKTVSIPGSKSLTNRALILAALTKGRVKIKNALFSEDTEALLSCLKTLGIKISAQKNAIIVLGDISKVKNKQYTLDANLSGTTIRFLTALCSLVPGEKILTGKEGLVKRPIKDLVDGLRQLGTTIEYLEKDGFPPIKVVGSIYSSSEVNAMSEVEKSRNASSQLARAISLNGSVSSQFLSAILMIAPIIGNVEVELFTELISKPYVAITIDLMKQFGVEVENNNFKKFAIKKQNYNAKQILIEGDYSSAAYFAAIAALTKSHVIIKNLDPNSLQADKEFLEILEKMGNIISVKGKALSVKGKGIKPVKVNMENCPDQIQTLAVLAAFAKGKTEISGISSLKVKETDRLHAIITELEKMGIKTEIKNNRLIIFGGDPHATTIETYGDHRMAMSFSVAASALSGMRIKDPEVVSKTFPGFFKEIRNLGIKTIQQKTAKEKIVLIGFGGTGKTSVAPLLAKKLKKQVLEMDDLIIKKSGKTSVADIFNKKGEKHFRKLELFVSQSLRGKKNVVISTGGGVIMNDKIMQNLKNNATTVLLDSQFETVIKRVSDISTRPLWKNKTDLKKLYLSRQPLYKQYADIIVETDGKSLGMVADEVMQKLEII